ncbi:MAG: DUF4913 domain-containing protein [Catenulispora sp.]|nr:DUF4913 domain-containing protein [Catenulispora sp.]
MEELETLAAQVDELQSTVTTLTGIVERLGGFAPTGGATAGGDEPQLYFPDVEAFVTAYFLPMYGWRVDGQRWHWCPRWWDHAEVIWRMETLWRSWESYRLQATGMSSWRLELDGQMPLLLGPEGPMAACRPADAGIDARHETGETPKAEPAPSGWWG